MTTNVKNLYVAGEAVGGIHGRNRLMGNSLLDIIVFGRSAGKNAAARSREVEVGELTLSHVDDFELECRAARNQFRRGIAETAPRLQTHKVNKELSYAFV